MKKIKSATLIIAILFSSITIYLYAYNTITGADKIFNVDEFFDKTFSEEFFVKYPQLMGERKLHGKVYLTVPVRETNKYINSRILIFKFNILMFAIILWQIFLITFFYEKFLMKRISAFDEAAKR